MIKITHPKVWLLLAATTFFATIGLGEATCTEFEILDGTCFDACSCPCGDGLGVLFYPSSALDCNEPESVCMGPVTAYDLVREGKGKCVSECPVDDCDEEEENPIDDVPDGEHVDESEDDEGVDDDSEDDSDDEDGGDGDGDDDDEDEHEDEDSSDDKNPRKSKHHKKNKTKRNKHKKSKRKRNKRKRNKKCTKDQLLNGNCPDACPCSCYSASHGPGFLVDTVPAADCDEKPERVCMAAMTAYNFVHRNEMACVTECSDEIQDSEGDSSDDSEVEHPNGSSSDDSDDSDDSENGNWQKKKKNRPDKEVTICHRRSRRDNVFDIITIPASHVQTYISKYGDCYPLQSVPGSNGRRVVDEKCRVKDNDSDNDSDSKSGKDGRHGNSDSRSGKDEDDAPTEPCKCPQYSKQFDGEEAVNPYVPKPEKCLLKRGKKQLMYEPDFPKSRPDVYIEVQISSGESFKFYPDDYPNSHDKNGGVIPLNDNTVFQKLYDEQEKFGGQGFKLRYVSKNGPGVWGSCKYTPIAFDLDGDGKVGHITSRAGFEIDITGDGDVEHLSEWFSPKEGILIDAHNKEGLKDFKNGVITGDHLMGDMGGEYTDGFAKLATYDDNCDDKLTGEELDGLYIWQDKNSNLILDDGELFELSDFNIVALNTIHDDFKSHAVLADGSTMLMEDLWFDPFQSSAEDERKVNLRAKITKNKKRWFNN